MIFVFKTNVADNSAIKTLRPLLDKLCIVQILARAVPWTGDASSILLQTLQSKDKKTKAKLKI